MARRRGNATLPQSTRCWRVESVKHELSGCFPSSAVGTKVQITTQKGQITAYSTHRDP